MRSSHDGCDLCGVIFIISGLKIHDFLRLSDINFGQCNLPKNATSVRHAWWNSRLQYAMPGGIHDFSTSMPGGLHDFTTAEIKVKKRQISKKNTIAVDTLIWTVVAEERAGRDFRREVRHFSHSVRLDFE